MFTRHPKWSAYPVYYRADYETFLKVKALKRWYWITVRDVAKWKRWNKKTVYRHPTAPLYCTEFTVGCVRMMTPDVIESWYQGMRKPWHQEIEPYNATTVDSINGMYERVAEWFAKHGKGSARIDPVMKHRAILAHRNGEYQTTKQIIDELKQKVA
jgi:hypothetical protein